jgi:hypothetical protein
VPPAIVPVETVPTVVMLAEPAQVDKAVFSTLLRERSVFNSDADRAVTVLSAFILTKVTADGFVRVNMLAPTVVAPNEVRPVDAVKPVLPPSHLSLSV